MYTNTLSHHGVLGMKWGKKNGPPYPLGASDHSLSEKKAGWRKSLDKPSNKRENKNNPSSEKKVVKIGAAVATTAIVAMGGYELYKHGKLDGLIDKGRMEND